MARLDLARLLRGAHRRAVQDVLDLLPAPARVEDPSGKVLLGAPGEQSERATIRVGDADVGVVIGGAGVEKVARVVAHLYEREQEKLALAGETLGRYKELTLVYDTSDALSRVLDVGEVAKLVASEAHRFLHASRATLYLVDRHRERLETLADVGAAAEAPSTSTSTSTIATGIEARVLASGQAEFMEHDAGTSMVAPLRAMETVFGLLCVSSSERERWTAGDLKLVTSLAANAASAISHAMLHRDQLRQQALRSQIERFVPASLLDAALEGRTRRGGEPLAVLFCDVGMAARTLDATLSTAEVVRAISGATSSALEVLIEHGAAVGTARGEMLVGLFGQSDDFRASARSAASAASTLLRRLDRRFGGPIDGSPGVGIARIGTERSEDGGTFYEGVGVAATLQAAAEGRILVDDQVALALDLGGAGALSVPGPRGAIEAHEVQP